jgi:hypothetical protein
MAHSWVGVVLHAQGDLADALKEFRAELTIMTRFAADDPTSIGWQTDLSGAHRNVGDCWRQRAMEPENADWQCDLARHHRDLSDVLQAAGKTAGALENARAALADITAIVKDLSPDQTQLELARIQRSTGKALRALGDVPGALAVDREAVRIMGELTEKAPARRYGNMIWRLTTARAGVDLLAEGDAATAREETRVGLAIMIRLAALDPSNAGWQQDLGELHRENGDAAKAASDDPARARNTKLAPRLPTRWWRAALQTKSLSNWAPTAARK